MMSRQVDSRQGPEITNGMGAQYRVWITLVLDKEGQENRFHRTRKL